MSEYRRLKNELSIQETRVNSAKEILNRTKKDLDTAKRMGSDPDMVSLHEARVRNAERVLHRAEENLSAKRGMIDRWSVTPG